MVPSLKIQRQQCNWRNSRMQIVFLLDPICDFLHLNQNQCNQKEGRSYESEQKF